MQHKDEKTDDAAGVGAEGGRRPTVVPAPAAAAPEISDRPRRRTFTAQTKLRVLAETDGAADVENFSRVDTEPAFRVCRGPDEAKVFNLVRGLQKGD